MLSCIQLLKYILSDSQVYLIVLILSLMIRHCCIITVYYVKLDGRLLSGLEYGMENE